MSEGASQLTIIVTAFLLTFVLVRFTRFHPIGIGCLLPIAAAVAVAIWLPYSGATSSTAPAAIPFMAIFAAMGSIPAALLAGILTRKLK